VQPIGNPATERLQVATEIVDDSAAGSAFLSVRVCGQDGPAAVWDDASLECALARDLIQASGGLPSEITGPALIARFDSVASAARIARRLQWSAQGLSETSHPYTLSILIQSGEEVARAGLEATQVEHSAAGSILVSDAAAKLLDEVPGFAVRPKQKGADFREIAWRAAENQTTREADERVLARLIEQTGRITEVRSAAAATGHETVLQPAPWLEPEPEPRRRSRMLLYVGLAAVLVIGAVVSFFVFRSAPAKNVASTVPSPAATTPAPAANTPAPTTVAEPAPAPSLTRAQKREELRKERAQAAAAAAAAKANSQPAPAPPPPKPDTPKIEVSGNCLYSADQLPHLLDSAEASRGRGQYKEAKRKIQAVLNCDRGNSRAREMLEQVQRAEAAQDGSDPQ
jgi:hypothetical protein